MLSEEVADIIIPHVITGRDHTSGHGKKKNGEGKDQFWGKRAPVTSGQSGYEGILSFQMAQTEE